jgi:hypothetical protein
MPRDGELPRRIQEILARQGQHQGPAREPMTLSPRLRAILARPVAPSATHPGARAQERLAKLGIKLPPPPKPPAGRNPDGSPLGTPPRVSTRKPGELPPPPMPPASPDGRR